MCKPEFKVAVVTSASTTLGLSVVEYLISQDYLVFSLVSKESVNSFNSRLLYRTKNVKVIVEQEKYQNTWDYVLAEIYRVCNDNKLQPKVDVLVNIPVYESIEQKGLEEVLSDNLLFNAYGLENLSDLMSNAAKANMILIYPNDKINNYKNLNNSVLTSSLNAFTRSAAINHNESKIYVDAICPDILDSASFYSMDSSQLFTNNYIQGTLDVLRYLVEGPEGSKEGQKYLINELGYAKEMEVAV